MALVSVAVIARNKTKWVNTILINTNRIISFRKATIVDTVGNSVTGTEISYQRSEDPVYKPMLYWTLMTEMNFTAAVKKALIDYRTVQEQFVRIPWIEQVEHGLTTVGKSTNADPSVISAYPHLDVNLDNIVYAIDVDTTNYPNKSFIYIDTFGWSRIRLKALLPIANLVKAESQSLSL